MGSANGTMVECCGDEATHNPKLTLAREKARQAAFRFAEPRNPVPAQIEDAGEYKDFFSAYKDVFVPYAGTDEATSHSLQQFLISLVDLSPTHGAVIRSMKTHAFGGKIRITRRFDTVFELERNDEVSEAEKLGFYQFLQQVSLHDAGGSEIDFRQLAQCIFHDLKSNGNAYLELIRFQVSGQKFFAVHVQRPEHCLYLATEKGEQRYIAISPIWNRNYIHRNPPDVIPLYPAWGGGDGVERTIIHIKEGNNTWYGRPDSIGSMLSQFYEFQNLDYINKQTAANFIGQAFIEVEMGDPESTGISDEDAQDEGYLDFADQFADNYSARGQKPQTVIVSARPYGTKPAFVFQFTPNTNENWYQVTGQKAMAEIIRAHGWSKRFLGEDAATGLSTNVYLDELEIQSLTNIKEAQEKVANPLNNVVIWEAMKYLEQPAEMENYSIEFSTPFDELLRTRKEQARNGTNPDNSLGSGEIQP